VKHVAYGSWRSPLTTERAVSDSLRLSETRVDGARLYWIEGRPAEGGRCVLMRRDVDGRTSEPLPAGCSVRSRVHEYGGSPYAVHDGQLCFVDDADQCLYLLGAGGPRRSPSPWPPLRRPAFDPRRPRVLCACEDHGVAGEPVTTLIAVDLRDGSVQTLARGADFYATPVPSPDGGRIAGSSGGANMPCHSTELRLGRIGEMGVTLDAQRIAGAGEPCSSRDGTATACSISSPIATAGGTSIAGTEPKPSV
jgi:hypothetical protein